MKQKNHRLVGFLFALNIDIPLSLFANLNCAPTTKRAKMDHLLNTLVGLAFITTSVLFTAALYKAIDWWETGKIDSASVFKVATFCTLSGIVCVMPPINGYVHQDTGSALMSLGGPVMAVIVGYRVLRLSYRMFLRLPRRIVAGTKVVLVIAAIVSVPWLIGALFRSLEW